MLLSLVARTCLLDCLLCLEKSSSKAGDLFSSSTVGEVLKRVCLGVFKCNMGLLQWEKSWCNPHTDFEPCQQKDSLPLFCSSKPHAPLLSSAPLPPLALTHCRNIDMNTVCKMQLCDYHRRVLDSTCAITARQMTQPPPSPRAIFGHFYN